MKTLAAVADKQAQFKKFIKTTDTARYYAKEARGTLGRTAERKTEKAEAVKIS